jgi:uncharacterized membrane protein YfcA
VILEPWQWALAAAGAFIIGLSKTGIAGLGILFVTIFANIMPPKVATGFVLPLLICGDLVSLALYRRHAEWRYLWRLFPWTAAGVVLGYCALGHLDDTQARVLIGGIVLALLAFHLWWQRRAARATTLAVAAGQEPLPIRPGGSLAAAAGVIAGFTTLVANAAGPVMIVYLLAMRLPKLAFLGTSAWFFLLLNSFKVPFMGDLGLVNRESLTFNLALAPAVIAGGLAGRWIVGRINQQWFERIALGLTFAAGVKLLLG